MKNTTGRNRNLIDQFYTKQTVAYECIAFLFDNIDIKENDLLIEPSAGFGAFSDPFLKPITPTLIGYTNPLWGQLTDLPKEAGATTCRPKRESRPVGILSGLTEANPPITDVPNIEMEAFDIDPKKDYITKQNFLELDLDKYKSYQSEGRKIHCIGNPPFGRQASLAKKFIKKSSLFCNTISFILPKSFKKESYQKAFPLNFHLIKEYDLTQDSFIIFESGIEKLHRVPCIFQIWEKKDNQRFVEPKPIEYGFKFVEKPKVLVLEDKIVDPRPAAGYRRSPSSWRCSRENVFKEKPDFAILRAGGGNTCGRISLEWKNGLLCYPDGWLFIKLDDKYDKEKFYREYQKINWKDDSNVGARSISKPTFIKGINALLRELDQGT